MNESRIIGRLAVQEYGRILVARGVCDLNHHIVAVYGESFIARPGQAIGRGTLVQIIFQEYGLVANYLNIIALVAAAVNGYTLYTSGAVVALEFKLIQGMVVPLGTVSITLKRRVARSICST